MGGVWQHKAPSRFTESLQPTSKLPRGRARAEAPVCLRWCSLVRSLSQEPEGAFRSCLKERSDRRVLDTMVLGGLQRAGTEVRYKPACVPGTGLFISHLCDQGTQHYLCLCSSTCQARVPHAKHGFHVSEACSWLLCSSALGLQEESLPDLRRAEGVCFSTSIKTFLFVTKISRWHRGLALFIYHMLFSLMHFHCLIHFTLCSGEILIVRPSCLLMRFICPCSCGLEIFSNYCRLARAGCIRCCSLTFSVTFALVNDLLSECTGTLSVIGVTIFFFFLSEHEV